MLCFLNRGHIRPSIDLSSVVNALVIDLVAHLVCNGHVACQPTQVHSPSTSAIQFPSNNEGYCNTGWLGGTLSNA